MSIANNLVTATVASNHAQTQLAIAAKIAKQNANSEAAVAKLVEAAQENLNRVVATTSPGVGQSLDISA